MPSSECRARTVRRRALIAVKRGRRAEVLHEGAPKRPLHETDKGPSQIFDRAHSTFTVGGTGPSDAL
jgi:hypothetical protein